MKSSKIASTNSPGTPYSSSITTTDTNKDLIQMKIYGGAEIDTESKLTIAIADFIHSCGLPFRFADHPKFRRVVMLSGTIGNKYSYPDRNQIGTKLLDINYKSYMEDTKEKLKTDIKLFGLSFYGDGATVRKMPLLNVMASGAYLHTAVMEIINCTSHLEKGEKDAQYKRKKLSGKLKSSVNLLVVFVPKF